MNLKTFDSGSVSEKIRHLQCKKCILDSSDDPHLVLDENGICNYCRTYDKRSADELFVHKPEKLNAITEQVKNAGKGKAYDCVIGLSGGVDSTYLAYMTKKLGLRPLAVHLDNGWNSELAVSNIQHIVQKLDIDLFTHVINWEEFKDIQVAYFKASVVDIEAITDHAIYAALFKTARKFGIHCILTGTNIVTEAVLPSHWVHRKTDWLNLCSIHKKFGKVKLKTFPRFTYWNNLYFTFIYKMKLVPLLNYLEYDKQKAKKTITEELQWRDYGGKHHESVFTRFYQSYILPEKFHIDKRKAHLSSLICSGQITREEALEEMKAPLYEEKKLAEDREFVIKKLGFTPAEFSEIMKMPPVSHMAYDSYVNRHWKRQARLISILKPFVRPLKIFGKA